MKRGTPDHPKMKALARILGITRTHAVGIMECLWQWTSNYNPDGDLSRWTDGQIADAVDWKDPAALIEALQNEDVGFLDGGKLVHDWCEHCEDSVHTKLARQGRMFACGCSPSLTRLPIRDREAFGEPIVCAQHTLGKRTQSDGSRPKASMPMPTPTPTPTPLPRPTPKIDLNNICFEETDSASPVAQYWESAADWASLTFWGEPSTICHHGGKGPPPRERVFLLRVARLVDAGHITGKAVADAVNGVKLRTDGKPNSPAAYLRSILRKNVDNFEAMLAKVPTPPEGM